MNEILVKKKIVFDAGCVYGCLPSRDNDGVSEEVCEVI
jgi:hypothetical protein